MSAVEKQVATPSVSDFPGDFAPFIDEKSQNQALPLAPRIGCTSGIHALKDWWKVLFNYTISGEPKSKNGRDGTYMP